MVEAETAAIVVVARALVAAVAVTAIAVVAYVEDSFVLVIAALEVAPVGPVLVFVQSAEAGLLAEYFALLGSEPAVAAVQ